MNIFDVVLKFSEINIYEQRIDKWQRQETVHIFFPDFITAKAKRVET